MENNPGISIKKIKIKKKFLIPIIVVALLILISFIFIIKTIFFPDFNPVLRFVSGTEYISGEFGQVIIRLADSDGEPITGANCNATILYPDKSYFLLDFPLTTSSEPGNYYGEFTTPTITGIYEETVRCSVGSGNQQRELKISSSFHVSVALNFIIDMSVLQAQRYNDLVARLNQTLTEINSTRNNILENFNQTFNQQFLVELNEMEEFLSEEINNSEANLTVSIDEKFSEIYEDFAALGASLQSIFTE
jgi:hypothetical protein